MKSGGEVTLENLNFSGGSSHRVLQVDNAQLTLEGVSVTMGSEQTGPSMRAKNSIVHIHNSHFSDGSGTESGHVYVSGDSTLTVTDSIFESGTAVMTGGAVLCTGNTTCSFERVDFQGNSAMTGGAINAEDGSKVNIVESSFLNNVSTDSGGAVSLKEASESLVVRNTFCKNEATRYGGAIYAYDSKGVAIHNNLFYQNTGGKDGGALHAQFGDASWAHNVLWENQSAGNGHAMNSREAEIESYHEIVVGNDLLRGIGGTGQNAVMALTQDFSLTYSLLWNNPNGNFNRVLDPSNITATEPEFQGAQAGCGFDYFKPLWNGNLVDAGSTTNPAFVDLDQSTPDLGLFGGPHAPPEYWLDNDRDGVPALWDCDDNDNNRAPGLVESCDGVDNNCDGVIDEGLEVSLWYPDNDGDGFGAGTLVESCAPPTGYVDNDDDCDDGDDTINPDAVEIVGNDVDENCDGIAEQEEDTGLGLDTDTGFDTGDSGRGLDENSEDIEGPGCSCATGSGLSGSWLALGLGLFLVRRRR